MSHSLRHVWPRRVARSVLSECNVSYADVRSPLPADVHLHLYVQLLCGARAHRTLHPLPRRLERLLGLPLHPLLGRGLAAAAREGDGPAVEKPRASLESNRHACHCATSNSSAR